MTTLLSDRLPERGCLDWQSACAGTVRDQTQVLEVASPSSQARTGQTVYAGLSPVKRRTQGQYTSTDNAHRRLGPFRWYQERQLGGRPGAPRSNLSRQPASSPNKPRSKKSMRVPIGASPGQEQFGGGQRPLRLVVSHLHSHETVDETPPILNFRHLFLLNDLSARHNRQLIAGVQSELEILLHQQDGRPFMTK